MTDCETDRGMRDDKDGITYFEQRRMREEKKERKNSMQMQAAEASICPIGRLEPCCTTAGLNMAGHSQYLQLGMAQSFKRWKSVDPDFEPQRFWKIMYRE